MRESQKAIEELKKAIKEYYYPATATEEDSFYSSADNIERILHKAIALAVEQNLTFDLDVLDNAIPDLVEVCIVHLETYKFAEALSVFLQIKNAIIMSYFSISKNGFRSELELKQLSEDVKDLKKKKKDLEEQIGILTHSSQTLEGIKQYDRDSLTVIESIKQKQSSVYGLIKEINMQSATVEAAFLNVEDIKAKEEGFIEHLESLNSQSTEMIERIKGIFGDVNRDSMASSFKERKEELDRGIKKNDFLNHSSLIAILLLSALFFIIPLLQGMNDKPVVVDAKFFYERFLMILPLGLFSWFTSRRSQYLFQLREDYAYKYSSAMAFEGYKRQAEANPEMHDELLKIAIINLGKTPTTIFERDLKHSPSDKVVEVMQSILPKK